MAEQYVELLRATSSSSALAQGAERNRMMLAIKMTKAALLAVACLPSAEAFGSIPGDELQPQKYMHFPEFYDIPRTMNGATTAGWTEWNAGESCASRGGHVFARPETHPDFRS